MSVHSVSVAKERLKDLLISDRFHCDSTLTDQLKEDLYHTVSKYAEINPAQFSVEITRTDIHITYMGENN